MLDLARERGWHKSAVARASKRLGVPLVSGQRSAAAFAARIASGVHMRAPEARARSGATRSRLARLPPAARDAFRLAKRKGCTPDEAMAAALRTARAQPQEARP